MPILFCRITDFQDASSVAVLGAMLFKDGKYVSGDAFEPEVSQAFPGREGTT